MLPKTSFVNGTTVEPAWLNSIPALNCEPLLLYKSGLDIANGGGSPAIAINPGIAANYNRTYGTSDVYIALEAALFKDISATWAIGNAGGLPSNLSLTPDTWYYVFVIYNTSTGQVDCGFDTHIGALNLLQTSGFDRCRRIGVVWYGGPPTYFLPFLQRGNLFMYTNNAGMSNNIALLSADTNHRIRPDGSPPINAMNVCKMTLTGGSARIWNELLSNSTDLATPAPFSYAQIVTDEGYINVRRDSSVSACTLYTLGYYDMFD